VLPFFINKTCFQNRGIIAYFPDFYDGGLPVAGEGEKLKLTRLFTVCMVFSHVFLGPKVGMKLAGDDRSVKYLGNFGKW